MTLTDDDLQVLSDMMNQKLKPINDRLDKIDNRIDKIDNRIDKIDNRLDIMEVKQSRMSEQLTEMQLSQKLFEMNTSKKFARLQDGMDTIEEILKINELIHTSSHKGA